MKPQRGRSRRIGDVWQGLGISGAFTGTNGKVYLIGLASLTVFIVGYDAIAVWNDLHYRPDFGLAQPIVWEVTSALGFVAYSAIAWLALQIAPLEQRPWWRVALIHLTAAPVYSLLHVASFMLLRKAVYALASAHYTYSFRGEFGFEFGKDVLAYALMLTVYWVVARLLREPAVPVETGGMFTIRDGARIVRVKMRDILAVSSAGNYVEFALRDGRKPLMRTPLSAIETELAPRGFVRVHRSWLVNTAQMTGLKPEGSGDYTVELGELNVPLSRRFPEALAKLRAA
ncbi:MAG TPA: LytTR family DNA-binding domain-containing protein [Rhizomicrobium sp.]|jgi:DNA-binding LytR/AlgR family response regulator|nr:LytTR family DNA-binding domain-containing protein [Rhizomicrobium sp.]